MVRSRMRVGIHANLNKTRINDSIPASYSPRRHPQRVGSCRLHPPSATLALLILCAASQSHLKNASIVTTPCGNFFTRSFLWKSVSTECIFTCWFSLFIDHKLQEIVMSAILSLLSMHRTCSAEFLGRILAMRSPLLFCAPFCPVVELLIIRKVHRLPCYAHLCFFSQKHLQHP